MIYGRVCHHLHQKTSFAVAHQFIYRHTTPSLLIHWLEYPIRQQHGFHYGKENYLISNMKIGFETVMAVQYLTVSAAAVYCIDIGIDCPIIAMVRFSIS